MSRLELVVAKKSIIEAKLGTRSHADIRIFMRVCLTLALVLSGLVWQLLTAYPAHAAAGTDMLGPNEELLGDQSITSVDGRFTLIMQLDGNLVLYQNGRGPLWATDTLGSGASSVVMQSDGNLVAYTADGVPVWASNTLGESSILRVQDDGNLVIYRESGGVAWATDTNPLANDRHITLTLNDIVASEITEGDLFGLFGGTHDEPYFVVNPEIWLLGENGEKQIVTNEGYALVMPDIEQGEHMSPNAVLWDGYLEPRENLTLSVILQEDDGSVWRDVALASAVPIVGVGGLIPCSKTAGSCLNYDDRIGSFTVNVDDSGGRITTDSGCSGVRADDEHNGAIVDLKCDGNYQLHVSLSASASD